MLTNETTVLASIMRETILHVPSMQERKRH